MHSMNPKSMATLIIIGKIKKPPKPKKKDKKESENAGDAK